MIDVPSQRKLRVLQVTGVMNRGGAEMMLMDIYRHISPDIHFDFLVNVKRSDPRPNGDFDEEIRARGAKMLYILAQWDSGVRNFIHDFKRIIAENGRPDVIHIHLNSKGGVISLAARLCGIKKIIVHSHADVKYRGSFLHIWPRVLELKLQKVLIWLFATDYWGCSPDAVRCMFYNRRNALVINNAIDIHAFQTMPTETVQALRAQFGAGGDTLVIGTVGRINPAKNLGYLIEIIQTLAQRGVNFRFVCAGRVDDEHYMQTVLQQVAAYGLEDRVHFIGDRSDVPALMAAFDLFTHASLNEGFGMVGAEAQASGLPCVLSTGFPREVDMGLGLVTYLPANNPEAWAEALLKAACKRCTERALIYRTIAERGFDIVENTRRIEQIYSSRKAGQP